MQPTDMPNDAPQAAPKDESMDEFHDEPKVRFLTLSLGAEHYAVEALRVREIIGLLDITPLPRTPAHVRGVVNLRGRIIPIVDLRVRLGMPEVEYTGRTCVVVLELNGKSEDDELVLMGAIVDLVNEVREIGMSQIDPPSTLRSAERAAYVTGLAKLDDEGLVVSLLDIDALLDPSQLLGAAPLTASSDVA